MKKVIPILIILMLFVFSVNMLALTKFDQESWIGAYFFKRDNLSLAEKYYPYLDIRRTNYRISSPGYAVRTILADYILSQEFILIKELKDLEVLAEAESDQDILNTLQSINQTKDKKALEEDMLELKALLLLKSEVKDRKEFLKKYLGTQKYNNLQYRFYHFKLVEYEYRALKDSIELNPSDNYRFNRLDKLKFGLEDKSSKDMLNQALLRINGAYNQKLNILNGELQASMMTTEKINYMLPIYPQDLINKVNSPLVSVKLQPMDLEVKKRLTRRLDNLKFVWRKKVNLLEYKFNQNELNKALDYYSLFTKEQLDYVKDLYVDKYGETAFLQNLDYDQSKLEQLLRDIKK